MLLLDVNVLTALVMGEHVHHRAASDWYLDNKRRGFLLCNMTQLGVIRMTMNPAIHKKILSAGQAAELLSSLERENAFGFVERMPPLSHKTVIGEISKARGHRQITDAYLIAVAKINGAKLATFDKKLAETFGSEDLELLPSGRLA